MSQENFSQRKKSVLSKLDKSSIGKWDDRIKNLCEKINSKTNYYTTSSCSGRIIVMVDQDKKGPGLFEFVSHNFVKLQKLKKVLEKIKNKNLKFKSEPPILHVSCKTIKDAEKILNKFRDAGWKRSGIISIGKNIVVELISTEKLEFPLVEEGRILVDDNFLKIVLKKANNNLKKGWGKIEKAI